MPPSNRDHIEPAHGPSLADNFSYRLSNRVYRLLPFLPLFLLNKVLVSMRDPEPKPQWINNQPFETTLINRVPVVWLARENASKGVLILLHGGAYVVGPDEKFWEWAAQLQDRTGLAVAAVIYRKPPEDPHPAAINDVRTVITSLYEDKILNASNWIMGGDSAGGGLAIAVTQQLIAEKRAERPAGLLLDAPWVDIALDHDDTRAHGPADSMLHRGWLLAAARKYAGGVDLNDSALSPVNGSFENFPPVFTNVGTRDLLLYDVRRFRDHVRAAGGSVEYFEQIGGVHVYVMADVPEAETTLAAQAAWVSDVLGVSVTQKS